MKKKIFLFVLLGIVFALVIAACSAPAQPTESSAAPTQISATATLAVAVEPTATKKPTKEPPKTGPLATAAALGRQVTLVPSTPIGGFDASGLTDDDYVGIMKQAWHIVNANYYRDDYSGADWDAIYDEYLPRAEQVISSEELHQLLTGLILELNDDHSRFTTYESTQARYGFNDVEGSPWTGINAWPPPGREHEYFPVWYVCSIGPAAAAGIERGDIILEVDGQLLEPGLEGFEREHASAVMFGTGSDSVTFTIQSGPDEDPREVIVKLGGASGCDGWGYEIVSESPRIGYIRISAFSRDIPDNIFSAIQDMEKEVALDGLIVDVRTNSGGFPNEAIAIFAKGVVGTEGPLRADKQRTVYRIRQVEGRVWNETTPVVVLTDGSSHSAGDYFPAALKELDRATIIGMNSAGNTDGHTGFGLADGSIIRLAVTFLELNDGSNIEGIGVTPDIEVPLGMWGLRQQPYDVQLQAAIDFLATQ